MRSILVTPHWQPYGVGHDPLDLLALAVPFPPRWTRVTLTAEDHAIHEIFRIARFGAAFPGDRSAGAGSVPLSGRSHRCGGRLLHGRRPLSGHARASVAADPHAR